MAKATIRAAARKVIEPWLEEEGFVGKYPEFHRLTGTQYHGLAVRKDKYGGYFWIEVGAKPFSLARHKRLLRSDPEAATIPRLIDLEFQQRLQINPKLMPEELLEQGPAPKAGSGKNYSPAKLEEAAASCLPQIRDWFAQRSD